MEVNTEKPSLLFTVHMLSTKMGFITEKWGTLSKPFNSLYTTCYLTAPRKSLDICEPSPWSEWCFWELQTLVHSWFERHTKCVSWIPIESTQSANFHPETSTTTTFTTGPATSSRCRAHIPAAESFNLRCVGLRCVSVIQETTRCFTC